MIFTEKVWSIQRLKHEYENIDGENSPNNVNRLRKPCLGNSDHIEVSVDIYLPSSIRQESAMYKISSCNQRTHSYQSFFEMTLRFLTFLLRMVTLIFLLGLKLVAMLYYLLRNSRCNYSPLLAPACSAPKIHKIPLYPGWVSVIRSRNTIYNTYLILCIFSAT